MSVAEREPRVEWGIEARGVEAYVCPSGFAACLRDARAFLYNIPAGTLTWVGLAPVGGGGTMRLVEWVPSATDEVGELVSDVWLIAGDALLIETTASAGTVAYVLSGAQMPV